MAYTARATATFIVVVVVVGSPERLGKAVVKTRKAWRRHVRGMSELKASHQPVRLTETLLEHAVKIGFDAVAVVVDKSRVAQPNDPEELYRTACGQALREALERFGSLSLKLDRRYTSARPQHLLTQALVGVLEELPGKAVVIDYDDSQRARVLQVADAVAWSVFQKHERKDETTWRIIQRQVVEVKL